MNWIFFLMLCAIMGPVVLGVFVFVVKALFVVWLGGKAVEHASATIAQHQAAGRIVEEEARRQMAEQRGEIIVIDENAARRRRTF